jgi:hypothetical protein
MVIRRTLGLCALAAVAGFVAWMGPFWLLPCALLLPACWGLATSRWQAGLAVLIYHLIASRALPFGAATYFGVPVLGVSLWLVAALILALTWAICWHPRREFRAFLLPLVCVLVAFPPIGIVGWMHPITAAGCLFPGWGWFGLLLTLALIVAMASMPLRYAVVTTGLAVAVAFVLRTPPPGVPEWQPLDTHFDCGVNRDFFRDFSRITAAKKMPVISPAHLVLFGESVGGLWTPPTLQLWEDHRKSALVFGCELPIGNADKCDNTLIALDAGGPRILYRQRMPVPVSMWRPWSVKGFRPHWFENPVVELDGYTVAPLICYEQILVWPILQSALHRPTVLLAVANDWWCRGTTAPGIQINSARAWARLFGLRYVVAFNY